MERDDECDMRLHEDCVHCMATAITLFVGEDGKPLIPPLPPCQRTLSEQRTNFTKEGHGAEPSSKHRMNIATLRKQSC